jgi:hypothetical protein
VPNKELIDAAMKKGKDLGHNPFAVKNVDGNNYVVAGVIKGERGQITFSENDMITNVGEDPFLFDGFELLKGEYAVVKGGKFVKQSGKITSD